MFSLPLHFLNCVSWHFGPCQVSFNVYAAYIRLGYVRLIEPCRDSAKVPCDVIQNRKRKREWRNTFTLSLEVFFTPSLFELRLVALWALIKACLCCYIRLGYVSLIEPCRDSAKVPCDVIQNRERKREGRNIFTLSLEVFFTPSLYLSLFE